MKDVKYRMASAVSTIALSVLERVAAEDLMIPVYHTVSDHHLPHIKYLYRYKNVDQFVSDLQFFSSHYSLIGLGELLAHRKNGRSLPPNALLLTFDDGLREISDIVAPILLEKKIPATFFLTIGFLDNRQLFFKHKASLLADRIASERRASDVANVKDAFSRHPSLSRGGTSRDAINGLLSVDYDERHLLDDVADRLNIDFSQYLADVQPYLTTPQVRQLIDQGFTVGAHSLDHP